MNKILSFKKLYFSFFCFKFYIKTLLTPFMVKSLKKNSRNHFGIVVFLEPLLVSINGVLVRDKPCF